jgi:SAM-dependent methyltransferase
MSACRATCPPERRLPRVQHFRSLGSHLVRRNRADQPWRTRNDPIRGRRRALQEEVEYWQNWLATQGGKWAGDYKYRFDPESEVVDPALREVLTRLAQNQISILDVGAGPVSKIGYRFPGKTLSLTAVDPLADEYNRLLKQHRAVAPLPVECLDGERVLEHFGPERFDVAYSCNALDHAVDPVPIIQNMIEVVRPDGYVVLRHVRNEAINQAYVQLHQWNFDERDGRFVIWRPGHELDMTDMLAELADTHCRIETNDDDGDGGSVVCVMQKRR